MTVYVCDWTHWQGGPVPAAQIKAEGFGMIKIKAGGAQSQGRYFEDPTFVRSAQNIREAQIMGAAYWYLMPGRPAAQAGLFYDMIRHTDLFPFLDLEQSGVTAVDYLDFCEAWHRISGGIALSLYTSKRFWDSAIAISNGMRTFKGILEDARWVSESIRQDKTRPYASQQVKAIQSGWWELGYGSRNPDMIQFTDTALVAGKQTVASVFRGSVPELRARMVG